jgi:hypothetical protein
VETYSFKKDAEPQPDMTVYTVTRESDGRVLGTVWADTEQKGIWYPVDPDTRQHTPRNKRKDAAVLLDAVARAAEKIAVLGTGDEVQYAQEQSVSRRETVAFVEDGNVFLDGRRTPVTAEQLAWPMIRSGGLPVYAVPSKTSSSPSDASQEMIMTLKEKIEPKGFDHRPYRVLITYDDGVKSSRPCHSIEEAVVKGAKLLRETRTSGRHATIALIAVKNVPTPTRTARSPAVTPTPRSPRASATASWPRPTTPGCAAPSPTSTPCAQPSPPPGSRPEIRHLI